MARPMRFYGPVPGATVVVYFTGIPGACQTVFVQWKSLFYQRMHVFQ